MDDLVRQPKYKSFHDLPPHIQNQARKWGEPDTEAWVLRPIPALGYRSIVETMNSPEGETRVLEFFRDLRGMLT